MKSTTQTERSSLEKAALRYAGRGWKVFPLSGKKPFPGTNGFREATTSPKQIHRWWREHPDANVGLACDSQNGPIVVDIDKDGPLERAFLERLDLPDTKEATSGKKTKRHLYFDPRAGADVARKIRPFGKKIEIDILGNGGYVVAPPSIHPETGRQYRWVEKRAPVRFPKALLVELKKAKKSTKNKNADRPPAIIEEGERDNLLTSLAGSMRRQGASEEGILAALREENETRVVPSLPDKDLKRIAKSIGDKEVPPSVLTGPIIDMNLARYFAEKQPKLRYCKVLREWLVWNGNRWKKNVTLEVERRLEKMIRGLLIEVGKLSDHDTRTKAFKDVNAYGRDGKLNELEHRARTQKNFVITQDKLDTDPWLLNVKNGTIDLRTGELLPHDPAHLITKMAPVTFDAKAKCPKWDTFLREITSEAPRKKHDPKQDTSLQEFLRYAVGYSLTGVIREHVLFFCYGGGANGKTTFLETIQTLLGDYAVTIDFETLLYHNSRSAERDLPRLDKARFASASETPTNARWSGKNVNQLTGGDTLSGRWLYQEKYDFRPTHKLWCRANDKPETGEQKWGFWRRMRQVPFRRTFKGKRINPRLGKQLRAELPGILNWAISGCLDWQKNGLPESKTVKEATSAYRKEENVYAEFLETHCVPEKNYWIATDEFYQSFKDWWVETRGNRLVPVSRAFGLGLGRLPKYVRAVRRGNAKTRGWKGYAPRKE